MQPLHWPVSKSRSLRILCLGAHCDDIEIGCGGTILRLLAECRACHVDWIVFGSNRIRRKEALHGAELFLKGAKTKNVKIYAFRDGFFAHDGGLIKQAFEKLKLGLEPDLVFTHFRGDLHQDHRVVNELTWNTFRNHVILEYEVPKYDGDLGSPNVFLPLSEELCQAKVRHIKRAYRSQAKKHWFTESTFTSLMRLRGMESRSASGFAEGFYARKIVL